ncbi:MAG: hypothetical protein JWM68_1431 [Verrucomicrobiales bacterium]|nr:hypothetical protein [Verrucomicrobiales bacterium]
MTDFKKVIGPLAIALTVVASVLLFFRLGHYSLWDDEAVVALSAKGILRSGDTTAVIDHNLVAYRHGILLSDLHDRSTPPLPAYVTAISFFIFGESALTARLPFAVCGMLWILLVLRWLSKEKVEVSVWILFILGIIGNVSLFLFFRQCRYYGIAILCSSTIAYLYLNWTGRMRELIWIALLSIPLFAANYMNFFALYGCLVFDYAIWGRKRRRLNLKEWAALLLPQIVVAGIIFSIWNPLKTGNSAGLLSATESLKVWLMCISFFDLNACEFGAGVLLLLAPFVALFCRDLWLLRSFFALVVYVVLTSALSPQVMDEGTHHSDIRYLAPIIPLCIFIGVRVLILITRKAPCIAFPLAILAFGSNLLEGVTLRPFYFHSTVVRYVGELMHPPLDTYKPTAAWVRDNVPASASVWVVPDEMTYPLMFHAPQPTYAWQLIDPSQPELKALDPIHFLGSVPPDYIIIFGPQMKRVTKELEHVSPPASYGQVALIDVFWRDTYRPELYWRRFDQKTSFNRATEAVYVLKRTVATGQGRN